MKKFVKLFSILTLSTMFVACTNENNPSNSESEESISESLSASVSESVDETVYTHIIDLEDINMEVGETYNLKSLVSKMKGLYITSKNVNKVVYNTKDYLISAYETGDVDIIINYQGEKQKVKVHVAETGTYSATFPFDRFHLEDKKLVAFGDSVTAEATIHGVGKTYVNSFCENYGMTSYKNYAIGGTTATYMYLGSNIYKEYASNTTAIDGCRVVKQACLNGEIDDADYAFIAYGHNDQYFQPPISVEGDDVYQTDTFETCFSYKGSYRYMINMLRKTNPNIRIILLNCTYSEYDIVAPSPYGKTYSYADYRQATKEIAEEMHCKYIDPWEYMKPYFDGGSTKYYYADFAHLTGNGHNLLCKYLFSDEFK